MRRRRRHRREEYRSDLFTLYAIHKNLRDDVLASIAELGGSEIS